MKTPSKPAFWVTNASPFNVSLRDLNLTIKAFNTVNLLDKRHYSYTLEQLLKSQESGSIKMKSDKIKVRDLAPPTVKKESLPILRDTVIPSRERSLLVIKEEEYDELKIADEAENKEAQKKLDEELARESVELEEDTQTSKKG